MKLGTRPLLAKMPPPPKKVLRQDRATPEPDFRALPCLFEECGVETDFMILDHLLGHGKLAQLALAGKVVHQVEHQLFQDHAQSARAQLPLDLRSEEHTSELQSRND